MTSSFHHLMRTAFLLGAASIGATGVARADTYIVTTLASSGPGSLADAVVLANNHPGGDTITFSSDLQGVLMVPTQLLVSSDVTVLGPSTPRVTIDGLEANACFHLIVGTSSFTCTNLSFTRCRPAILLEVGGLNLTVDRCSFADCATAVTLNPGRQGGAIALGSVGTAFNAMITNSTFLRNRSGQGGAFAASGGTQTVINCTFVDNSAIAFGGAVAVTPGVGLSEVLNISSCTFTGNSVAGGAAPAGGAVFATDSVADAFTCSVALRDSIVYANTAATGPDLSLGTAVIVADSTGYNLIGVPSSYTPRPSDIIGADPLLGLLQDNGGATMTRAPLASSPAIDHGALDPLVMFDQRGISRPFDFPGIPPAEGGNNSDIGAVEVTSPPCPADFNHDGVVNSQDFFDFLTAFFTGC